MSYPTKIYVNLIIYRLYTYTIQHTIGERVELLAIIHNVMQCSHNMSMMYHYTTPKSYLFALKFVAP